MEGEFPNLQLNYRVGISDENVLLDVTHVGFEFTSRMDDPHFLDMILGCYPRLQSIKCDSTTADDLGPLTQMLNGSTMVKRFVFDTRMEKFAELIQEIMNCNRINLTGLDILILYESSTLGGVLVQDDTMLISSRFFVSIVHLKNMLI